MPKCLIIKMMTFSKKDRHDPNFLYQQLKSLTNAAHLPLVQDSAEQEIQVQMLPNESVTPGKFKAHPTRANAWFAHPQTILALRPDVFVLGENGLEDFEKPCKCYICHQTFDLQFFKLCPCCLKPLTT